MAVGFWFNIGMQSSAEVRIAEDGMVTVMEGSPDIGGSRASMALVSRPEDCPEFSGAGGGGGCADSSSGDCGSDDDGEDAEPTMSGADSDTRRIMNCIAGRQEWKDHLASISDANFPSEQASAAGGPCAMLTRVYPRVIPCAGERVSTVPWTT